MKKLLLSAAVLAVIFTGCKKDDDDNGGSRQSMMIGTWTVGQFGYDVNSNGNLETGETAPASPSTVSGTLAFNSNGTVISNLAAFGFPAESDTSQWALVNNDNYIRSISGTDTSYMEIKSMTSTSMTLRDTSFGGTYPAWFVLSK